MDTNCLTLRLILESPKLFKFMCNVICLKYTYLHKGKNLGLLQKIESYISN